MVTQLGFVRTVYLPTCQLEFRPAWEQMLFVRIKAQETRMAREPRLRSSWWTNQEQNEALGWEQTQSCQVVQMHVKKGKASGSHSCTLLVELHIGGALQRTIWYYLVELKMHNPMSQEFYCFSREMPVCGHKNINKTLHGSIAYDHKKLEKT